MFPVLLTASSLALAASVPTADPAVSTLGADTIVVHGEYFDRQIKTATKTPTPLIDVPQSVTVVTERQIDEQAFLSIEDITRFTPGISTGQGEGHRDQVTIRGQNTTADFFIDGLRDDVQYFRPLYNVESVEVLRGANAMIFGRGGGGGVINRTTKTPRIGETFTRTTASIDSFGATYLDADINLEVAPNASFRLNGFYEHLENHRDVFEGDRFAFNSTLGLELSSRTDVVLSYEYVNDDRIVDRGVPSLDGEPLRGVRDVFFGDPDYNETTLEAHILRGRIDHEINQDWSANATLQYADYDKAYRNVFPVGFDEATGEVTLDNYADTTARENLIGQANLIGEFSTGPVGHTLLIGAEFADQSTQNARDEAAFAGSNDDQVSVLFSDPLVVPAFVSTATIRDRASEVDVASVYLQDQLDIGDHVKIVGGVRYDRFDIDVSDFVQLAEGNDGEFGRVDEEISPRIGAILKPAEDVSFYASYAKSFLPRSGDQFLSLNLGSEALDPEEFENYEAGVKWNIRPDLAVTAAIFRLDRESGTTADPNNPGNAIIIGSRTEGVELQLVGAITERWHVTGGYSFLDAKERGRVSGDILANRELAQVPSHMFSIWNRFDPTDRIGLSLGITHQADQFATIGNQVTLPSFTRVDVAADYAISDRWAIQVNVENLLDEDYFPSAHNTDNITTGEPLNARLTLSSAF